MSWQLIEQELVKWAGEYEGEKFHGCFCDPPYDLAFMGKKWDKGANFRAWAEAIKSVLLPGAIVFAFGGTRTWHRLACGFEDAGFQMWDTLMWIYGQGFPKAQDISKLIDAKNGDEREVVGFKDNKSRGSNDVFGQYNTDRRGDPITAPTNLSAPWSGHKTCALKPAWEPILAFRLPTGGTYAENALEYGSGALNVDAGRIPTNAADLEAFERLKGFNNTRSIGGATAYGGGEVMDRGQYDGTKGRYPANLILDEVSAAQLDQMSGTLTSGAKSLIQNGWGGNGIYGGGQPHLKESKADSGGASRFFYTAKASSKERNAGLEGFPLSDVGEREGRNHSLNSGYRMENGVVTGRKADSSKSRNTHPTVKPIDLNRYLASLLLPPDSVKPRRLLVPFAGSGSEMIGALKAGWDEVVGVEREAEYCKIARARLAYHAENVLWREIANGLFNQAGV